MTRVRSGGAATRVRSGWFAVFAVALAVQLVAIYVPRAPGEGGVPHLDKVVHATIFAVPVLAGLLAGLPRWPLVGLLGLHAAVSEELQSALLPHRDGSWQDASADLLGVVLGVLAAAWVRTRPRGTTPA